VPSVLVLQHLAAEGPALVATALRSAGLDVVVHRTDLDPSVPALDGHRGLVVMGGPSGAGSDEGFPSRRAELGLLAKALDYEIPVLGVCLGAQLLAVAAGGTVLRGPAGPEIGWGQVSVTGAAIDDPLFAVGPFSATVLHWHHDTFTLPPGASLLASSKAYENQAFRVGPSAWGLQFHAEVDEAAVRTFVSTFAADTVHAPEGPEGIVAVAPAAVAALGPMREALLDGFAAVVATS
jgi:GMP synthase-like glutamine amidotransferase